MAGLTTLLLAGAALGAAGAASSGNADTREAADDLTKQNQANQGIAKAEEELRKRKEEADAAKIVQNAEKNQAAAYKKRPSKSDTVFTSPLGLEGQPAQVNRKTLLGF